MTIIYHQLCATSKTADGRTPIHMYIGNGDPTRTDNPGCERRALKDAENILREIIGKNVSDDELQLLQEGDPPWDAMPVFVYAVGVSWDRANDVPHYTRIGYRRIVNFTLFADVYALGMELYDEIFAKLRKYEKKLLLAKNVGNARCDAVTKATASEQFGRWASSLIGNWVRKALAHEANGKRFGCERYRNGFCTPSDMGCLCFRSWRCEEVAPADISLERQAQGVSALAREMFDGKAPSARERGMV